MAPAGQWPCSLDAAGSLPTRRALSIRLSDFNKYATHGPCVWAADRIHKRLIQTIVNGLADKPLVLNGGTALMRAYHRDRYSEDIPRNHGIQGFDVAPEGRSAVAQPADF